MRQLNPRAILARQLKEWRRAAGVTQAEVSARLGYTTPQFVSNWERGVASPPTEAFPVIAELYRVSQRDVIDLMDQYQEMLLQERRRDLVDAFKKHRKGGEV